MNRGEKTIASAVACAFLGVVSAASGALSAHQAGPIDLREAVKRIKPSVLGIGTFQATRRVPAQLIGTGFVVADGRHVLTSAHVYRLAIGDVAEEEKEKATEFVVSFLQSDENVTYRHLALVAEDGAHDVAILKFGGAALAPVTFGNDENVEEGQSIAFTGFPLGAVLGLYPVTHRGIVSAIAPIVLPANASGQLDSAAVEQLRNPFSVFQLDAVAYPGNSGSPLFDPETGVVYGMVNSTFVKRTKEKLLPEPTGISYAIPIRHALKLLQEKGLAR